MKNLTCPTCIEIESIARRTSELKTLLRSFKMYPEEGPDPQVIQDLEFLLEHTEICFR